MLIIVYNTDSIMMINILSFLS